MPIDVVVYACEFCYRRYEDRVACIVHEKREHKMRDQATDMEPPQQCPSLERQPKAEEMNEALVMPQPKVTRSSAAHQQVDPATANFLSQLFTVNQMASFAQPAALQHLQANLAQVQQRVAQNAGNAAPMVNINNNDKAQEAHKKRRKTANPVRVANNITPPNNNEDDDGLLLNGEDSMNFYQAPAFLTDGSLNSLSEELRNNLAYANANDLSLCSTPLSYTSSPMADGKPAKKRRSRAGPSSSPGNDDGSPSQTAMCDICGKTFKSRYHVRFHKQCKHGGRRFTCTLCNFAFDRVSNVKRHLLRTHNKQPEELAQFYEYTRVPKPLPDPELERLAMLHEAEQQCHLIQAPPTLISKIEEHDTGVDDDDLSNMPMVEPEAPFDDCVEESGRQPSIDKTKVESVAEPMAV